MKIIAPLFAVLILIVPVICDHHPQTDTIAEFLHPVDDHKTLTSYFVLECDNKGDQNLMNALHAAKLLADKWFRNDIIVEFIVIPISDHDSRPITMYTNKVNQLEEILSNYACKSYLTTSDDGSDSRTSVTTDGLFSILSTIVRQLQDRDTGFLFSTGADNYELWPSSLKEMLKIKQVTIKVLSYSDETQSISIENFPIDSLDPDTGRRLLIYQNQFNIPRNKLPGYETSLTNLSSIHQIKTISKYATQNTRTVLTLPPHTWQLTTTIQAQGIVRKALLKSPSGITMDLITQWMEHTNTAGQNRIINLQIPIYWTPADWILLADGDRYNITGVIVMGNPNNIIHNENGSIESIGSIEHHNDHKSKPAYNTTNQEKFPSKTMISRYDKEEKTAVPNIERRSGMAPQDVEFDDLTINASPTIIDVDLQSTFFAYSGEEARFVFNVRNNKIIPNMYYFWCFYIMELCLVYPRRAFFMPGESKRVTVNVRATGSESSSNVVTLISESADITEKRAYLYIGKQKSDTIKPDIHNEYNGNCDDANSGNTCHRKKWSANVVAQDYESGLLNFWSEPLGLEYTGEFISGTREGVTARFVASCCNPKVDILATDLRGNTQRIILNVEHQYLSATEIIAIVLASILLIILFTAIVYGIIRWKRKANERSFLDN